MATSGKRRQSAFLITFEGGEGAGKSTQVRALAEALSREGFKTRLTREPGGSPAAERIRSVLLDAALALDPMTELMLFSAARRDHWLKTIAPAKAAGEIVICDRFYDSTMAYQGAAGGVSRDDIRTLTAMALGPNKPDLTIILDIDPVIGLARAAGRRGAAVADSFEGRTLGFHQRIRQELLDIAAADTQRCRVFPADRPEQELAADILSAVLQRLT
jgi:dTMP kinase